MRLGGLLLPTHVAAPRPRLPFDAATMVLRVLDTHHPHAIVVVISPDGCEVEDREARVALLRRAGAVDLARQIKTAIVPRGSVLLFTDLEVGTGLCTVPIEELCAEASLPVDDGGEPACMALANGGRS